MSALHFALLKLTPRNRERASFPEGALRSDSKRFPLVAIVSHAHSLLPALPGYRLEWPAFRFLGVG